MAVIAVALLRAGWALGVGGALRVGAQLVAGAEGLAGTVPLAARKGGPLVGTQAVRIEKGA